jgi:hypothetical protein
MGNRTRVRLRLLLLIVLASVLDGAAGTLSIVNPTISDSDGGAALPSGFTHVPGETLFFSFQVAGYQASSAKVHLSYKIDAFDPHGVRIVEPIASEIADTLAPEDKNWKPTVHQEIQVPPLADSGVYKIAVSLTDEIGHTAASQELSFAVRGRPVEPSDTLVIRNFRFYRGEQDTEPLQKAAYRPGDAVWARFDIIGFKYGPDHAIQVSYGVAVIAPSGKELWSQPEAAVEKSQSFYPKRYVPGSMSLNLQPNIRPGEYGMVITAHDQIGNQTYEARQNFSIE